MRYIARVLRPIFDWLGYICDRTVIWCDRHDRREVIWYKEDSR